MPLGPVWLADDADVLLALRMDAYTGGERASGVPVGLYAAGGLESPVYLDCDFLLGPGGRPPQHHRRLRPRDQDQRGRVPARQHLPDVSPRTRASVAALCFNVKGPDLCFLDQPADLSRGGSPAVPAARAPAGAVPGRALLRARTGPTGSTSTPCAPTRRWPPIPSRSCGACARCSTTPRSCSTATTSMPRPTRSSISWPSGWWAGSIRTTCCAAGRSRCRASRTSRSSSAAIFDFMEALGKGAEVWKTHHVATIRKVRNRLSNISTRSKGLVTDDGAANDLPWGQLRGPQRARGGCRRARSAGAGPGLRPRRLQAARASRAARPRAWTTWWCSWTSSTSTRPRDGPDTYVRKMLLDLSERGRYLGLVLFSAQQFRSQVQRRVVGNAGTGVYGRMDADELATPGYATLSPGHQDQAGDPAQGRADGAPSALHPAHLREVPPAGGARRARRASSASRPRAMSRSPTRSRADCGRSTAASPSRRSAPLIEGRRQDDVRRALAATRRERPGDALAYFTACLGKRIARRGGAAPPRHPRGQAGRGRLRRLINPVLT